MDVFVFAIISASVALHRPTFLPHRHPSPLLLSAEPQDFSKLVADSEAFLEDMGIGEDAASTEAALRLNQPLKPPRRKRRKKAAELPPRPVKASKANKFRIGCYGCGADLQTTNPAAAGYVEPERYELKAVHRQLKLLLCRRCRALTHGEILPAVAEGRLRPVVPAAAATSVEDAAIPFAGAGDDANNPAGMGVTTPEQLRAELAPLRAQKVLAVLLVDVTDVTGSFLPRVRDLIGGNPIVLIGTKVDLLPQGTNAASVLAWLFERLSPRLNVIDTHLISARTGAGVETAAQAILRERKGRDTFILGAANVGKSLFVGSFLEQALGGRGKRLPISSATPGTTLKLIGVDCFEGGSMLFDTPGLHLPHRLSAHLLPEELGAILPRGRINPYTPPPPEGPLTGTTYFWGGLVRVDVVSAPLCARLSFVSAYSLRVSSCTGGPEAAAAHYAAEAGKSLTPPLTPESASELGELEMRQRVEVDLTEMEQSVDVSISGLGWICLGALASLRKNKEMKMVIDVWVPKDVMVSLRPPMPIARLPNEITKYDDADEVWE